MKVRVPDTENSERLDLGWIFEAIAQFLNLFRLFRSYLKEILTAHLEI